MAFDGKTHKKHRKMIYDIIEKRTGAEITPEDHEAIKKIMKDYAEEMDGDARREIRTLHNALSAKKNERRRRAGSKNYNPNARSYKPQGKPNFQISDKMKKGAENAEEITEKEQEKLVDEAVHETRKLTKEEIEAKLPKKEYL